MKESKILPLRKILCTGAELFQDITGYVNLQDIWQCRNMRCRYTSFILFSTTKLSLAIAGNL